MRQARTVQTNGSDVTFVQKLLYDPTTVALSTETTLCDKVRQNLRKRHYSRGQCRVSEVISTENIENLILKREHLV